MRSERQTKRLLYGSPEAAEMLDVSTKTLLALVRARALPFIMIGRVRKFAATDLESYLAKRPINIRPVNDCFGEREAQRMLERSRTKATLRNMRHTLSLGDIAAIIDRSQGYCELTGIPFEVSGPYQASLDRKDSSQGYVAENCRLVCYAVNLALNEWGDEVLLRIAHALVAAVGKR